MLKTIAGVLKPTKGQVTVGGNIAPLIELGAGFDMDLTARENVFLNGALLGYNRAQMEAQYEDIVEFFGIKVSLWMFPSRIFLPEWYPAWHLRSQQSGFRIF